MATPSDEQAVEEAASLTEQAKADAATEEAAETKEVQPDDTLPPAGEVEGEEAQGDEPADSLTDKGGEKDSQDEDGSGDGKVTALDTEKLTVPEGFEMDKAVLAHMTPVLLEGGVGQEAAQGIVNAYAEMKLMEVDNVNTLIEAQRAADIETIKADSEIGGENFEKAMVGVSRVMQMFDADGEVNDMLRAHGVDNNPLLVKLLHRISTNFAEDDIVAGKGGGGDNRREVDIMFPATAGL